jgi:hypothetical protein
MKTFAKFKTSELPKGIQTLIKGGGSYCDALEKCNKSAWKAALNNGLSNYDQVTKLHLNLVSACNQNFGAGCLNEIIK